MTDSSKRSHGDGGQLPQFPYGAVYFRKSNPPKEDWERDYRVASEDGFNVFRHWFMWGSIEVAPGQFDWADYDRQLELGERFGIGAVIAEISHSAPEWAFADLAHCRFVDAEGAPVISEVRRSSATGGFPGLCLDHPEARAAVGRFITAFVERYRGHPALVGYDLWNETNLHSSGRVCFCSATISAFREWLRERYGDLEGLGRAWHRYSYTDWSQVDAPRRQTLSAENLDWLAFVLDNAYDTFKWRVDLVRALDPSHAITAHGVDDQSLARITTGADHAWRAGAQVDIYGFTGGSPESRFHGEWKHWSAADLTRSGAAGKPYWAAEMASGPNWSWGRFYKGHPRGVGGQPDASDIRLHTLTSMAAGARGIFSNRWRPVLDADSVGSLGFYGMDGGRTDRSEMAKVLSTWANQPQLSQVWDATPVRGDIGILVTDESQWLLTLYAGDPDKYASALRGAYRGFFDNNVQADWICLDQLHDYDLVYLPCPIMLHSATAASLVDWVEAGGTLVSEGCPGYFGDRGRAGAVQPNSGLDRLFGARESWVEFHTELLEEEGTTFRVGGSTAAAGLFRQRWTTDGGADVGTYDDGGIAVVDNDFGRGRTRLIGASPGYGYWRRGDMETLHFFSGLLAWAGRAQSVSRTRSELTCRVHEGAESVYVWVVNSSRDQVEDTITLGTQAVSRELLEVLWGDVEAATFVDPKRLKVSVPPFDALLVRVS